ncbi:MAG: response regulator [Candidatus Azobacteroides sp.]|nr:response regulator [Candidatus Azobacteroides sp.]
MKKTLLFLFSFFVCFSFSHAQIGIFYSTDKDLSSSLINSIYQDHRNYIWIATEDGLNKFDGVRFTIYKNRPNDSSSIKSNYVRCLLEDSFGRFWIGCINGLLLYDRATDSFKEVALYNGDRRVTPHVTHIIESKDHEIWIITSEQGVIRIKEGDTFYRTDARLSSRLSSMYLTYAFQDSRGVFWIASENQGLNMYNPRTDEVVQFKAPLGIGSNQISTICEDRYGNIFVGTLTDGLYKYNPRMRIFEAVPYVRNSVLFVKCLLVDNKNRLLVGTDGQGIKIYDEEKGWLNDFRMLSTPFDFSRMKVHAICQDNFGNIWAGLFQKGVFLDPENPNKFNYWGFKSFDRNLIGSGCIMSLLKDKTNVLWIGTDNDGVYKLDKNNKTVHFASNDVSGSAPNTVLSMVDDDAGNIWLGSYLSGLVRLDKRTGICTYYSNHIQTPSDNNTAGNKIFCLVKDKQNRLWIGTNGAGVYVFDLREQRFVDHYSQSGNRERHIPNDWINSIICDRDGLIWVGSYNGICSIDPLRNQIVNYSDKPGVLPGDVVYCISEDRSGNLWIGTTEGLSRFDKKTLKSKIYTVADGLSSNVVCGILQDDKDNIWLSTHSGISKLPVGEDHFVNYYGFDGLQGNEFSMGAAFRAGDGEMFFGGTGGISSFYPSEINDRHVPISLYLTGLYIMGNPVVSGQKSGNHVIFNGFISDVDTIHLNYKDNLFALEFSTFDFGRFQRVYYRYMLEGLNSHWLNTEQGVNRINFTNLGYGTYRLRIKAFVYNNSSEEKIITLIISPPWYLTWWAKLFYVLMGIALMWGITRYISERIRHKNELMRREHAEQISEAKLQFFINISHEIRTPMTLIISPLEKLISENTNDEKRKVYLLMYRNAQRILRLINQLMDVRKLDKGLMLMKARETDMVGFIDDLMQTFEYQAAKRDIHFSFVHADEQLKVWVDMNNFDKVLVNILSNAFKFTPDNGEITITLRTGTDDTVAGPLSKFFEIVVADTGIGIEESKIEKIFERFYQINNENGNSDFGTGVGLHLARSLVQLQHGVLYARNRLDRSGSEFIIRLPLGNAHLKDTELSEKDERQPAWTRNKLPAEWYNSDDGFDQAKTKSKTKYRVLIVDDENEIRRYLSSELSDMYHVYEAVNGKEALDFILREKPDLVISDVMMPEMDGVTLCKKVKSNININRIPVILLTAKATDKDKAEGYDIGADAYVSKPFNVDLLKRIIAGIIENRERLKHKAGDSEENKALIKPVVLRSSDQILYEKIIKIINENISESELNVELLASGVGMSRVHMHRKLKELTGMSARDFIRSIRLKQAGELLSNQKLTVSEVAYALGFSNLSHFSNSFREFYGMSPKEYAERNRK